MQLPKNIKVIIKDDGSVQVDYSGFEGASCFHEAQRLYEFLKKMGVDVKVSSITPKVSSEQGVKANV